MGFNEFKELWNVLSHWKVKLFIANAVQHLSLVMLHSNFAVRKAFVFICGVYFNRDRFCGGVKNIWEVLFLEPGDSL